MLTTVSPDFILGNLKHSCVSSEQTKVFWVCGEGAFWLV